MLILSRHLNEKVTAYIPASQIEITVMVIEIRGDKVRLGFAATRDGVELGRSDVEIHRDEVWQQIFQSPDRTALVAS